MYFTFIKKSTLIKFSALVIALVCLITSLSITGAYAVFYNKQLRRLPIYYVKTDEKKLAISFDCAWGTDYTDSLLQTMDSFDVKCTFFTVEFWAKKHPDYLKKIASEGHEIGTHSATHPYMSKLDEEQITSELTTSCQAISEVTGVQPTLFRAPYGDYDDLLIETAQKLGLFTIQWDVDSLDWKDLSAKEITNRVVSRVKPGSIVLFHNQGLHTAEALPIVIATLQNKGYTFVPIGELIYKENYVMLSDGGQQRND